MQDRHSVFEGQYWRFYTTTLLHAKPATAIDVVSVRLESVMWLMCIQFDAGQAPRF